MAKNFTRVGALKLGRLVQQAMDEQEPPWTQAMFVARLESVGHTVNLSAISRFVNGQSEKPDPALLLSIAELKFVRRPTGEPYTLEELILVGCEEIDPDKLAVKISNGAVNNGLNIPYPGAVAEIRKGIGSRSVSEFAKMVRISEKRLTEILTSTDPSPGAALPTWKELLALSGVLYKDKNVEPLIRLYGYGTKLALNGHSSR